MCVILALGAKRLLHKRCEAYLGHVIDKSSSEVTLDGTLIVQEFLDVILDDLSSLPAHRELEMELNCCQALVSIPPYRMAIVKLKKLKTQLQDLADKDFI